MSLPSRYAERQDVFCDNHAELWFCETHNEMALRGSLDSPYTDGSTPRSIIREHFHEQF